MRFLLLSGVCKIVCYDVFCDFVFAVVMVAGDEHLSKNTNSGAELEQVNPVVGESKSSPIGEPETR